ncbi:COG1361 family protein [Nitrosopumilus sp. S6]
MNQFWIVPFLVGLFFLIPSIHAETLVQNLEGGMNIEITHPDEIVVGREGIISILVKNNGWEEKQDISFEFSLSEIPGLIVEPNKVIIEKLATGGSYGENVNLNITKDASPGIHFLNIKYSQVLVSNNETPQKPFYHDIAIPIIIKEDPNVTIHTKTPESIFTNAEFPIEVEVISEDIDITDVKIKIIPPKDIEFRGETMHSFSKIEKNTLVGITSRIITPTNEVNTEYKLPFEIIVQYTDDVGDQKEDSQTVSVVLRPRTFMELTTDGGIWIGDFFIAPYVSLGTIIGIPAGTIISLLVRRKTSPKKRSRKKKV